MKIEPKVIISIFLVAFALLAIPQISRIDKPFIGSEPYLHARIAETIASDGISYSDNLSFNKPYILNLFDLVLANSSKVIPINLTARILPLILGIASLLFFFLIVKDCLNDKVVYATLSILVFSPVFIYAFTLSNPISFVIFLNLLAFYFFHKNWRLISAVILAVIPFFGLFHAVVSLILVLCISLLYKKLKNGLLVSVPLIVISMIYCILIYITVGLPDCLFFFGRNYFRELVSNLGAFPGFNIFTLFLVLMGIYATRSKKQKLVPVYFATLIFFLAYFFFKPALFYLLFPFSFFAASGLVKLITMNWELKQLRDISVVILLIGIVFSSIVFVDSLVHDQPSKEIAESLTVLESYPFSNVFSHYSYGFWIQYYSGKQPIADPMPLYAPLLDKRIKDSVAVFYSRNLENTKAILGNYNSRFIFITPEMKNGLVWSKPDEGLLFLFRNSETFTNIYNKSGFEIWEFKNE